MEVEPIPSSNENITVMVIKTTQDNREWKVTEKDRAHSAWVQEMIDKNIKYVEIHDLSFKQVGTIFLLLTSPEKMEGMSHNDLVDSMKAAKVFGMNNVSMLIAKELTKDLKKFTPTTLRDVLKPYFVNK
jgi:hypothetical protein